MPSLPILQSPARVPEKPARGGMIRSILLRLYRLGIIVAIVWIVHRHQARLRIDGDAPITASEVKPLLPAAARLVTDESDRAGLFVLDSSGQRIGYVLRTSPLTQNITGYQGPTDTLIALDTDMRVVGIRLRSSGDTKTHVKSVADDEYFMKKIWTGKTWDEVAGMDPKTTTPQIEGVSGASLTSLCVANSIHQRFRSTKLAGVGKPSLRFRVDDIGLMAVIAVACAFSFTRLRGVTWARRAFQIVLIGYLGFWNGQLLAQSLWNGWAATTIPWRLAPGLALLAAAALVVPWTTRRALYCSQICPHGAAQELLGRLKLPKLHLHRGLEAGLRWLPALLIAMVLAVSTYQLPIDLAGIEPFDAYLIRAAGLATVVVAVVGLAASLFVPMAYCKFGCPTGLVLSFVRSHGRADRFGRRDIGAALMVGVAVALFASYPLVHHWIVR